MNGYIAIGLILIIVGLYFMSKNNDTPKIIEDKNFCVKVQPFAGDMFCIIFSNDGFKTEEQYEEMLGDLGWGQVALYHTTEKAIKVAKTLKSYQQCIDHNKIIKDKSDAWHKQYDEDAKERYKKWDLRDDKEIIVKCDKP